MRVPPAPSAAELGFAETPKRGPRVSDVTPTRGKVNSEGGEEVGTDEPTDETPSPLQVRSPPERASGRAPAEAQVDCEDPLPMKADGSADISGMLEKARLSGAAEQSDAELAANAQADMAALERKLAKAKSLSATSASTDKSKGKAKSKLQRKMELAMAKSRSAAALAALGKS